jgi:hypothetical protein
MGAQDEDRLRRAVTSDAGAVQGTPPVEPIDKGGGQKPGSPAERRPPDAGEIEWAGTVSKKPPHPGDD